MIWILVTPFFIETLLISLQAKGNEAATTGGAQSVLNAAAATNVNEVLDSILPPTVASYVELVTVHLNAGRLAFISHLVSNLQGVWLSPVKYSNTTVEELMNAGDIWRFCSTSTVGELNYMLLRVSGPGILLW
jgi:hypothetical protein